MKLVDGFHHPGQAHLMHFKSHTQIPQQGNGQLAPEMLAELLQTVQNQH